MEELFISVPTSALIGILTMQTKKGDLAWNKSGDTEFNIKKASWCISFRRVHNVYHFVLTEFGATEQPKPIVVDYRNVQYWYALDALYTAILDKTTSPYPVVVLIDDRLIPSKG